MNAPPGRYWPTPQAAEQLGAVPPTVLTYTLTADGVAALDADLAADAQAEPEAGG
jgi:hypothetical protein